MVLSHRRFHIARLRDGGQTYCSAFSSDRIGDVCFPRCTSGADRNLSVANGIVMFLPIRAGSYVGLTLIHSAKHRRESGPVDVCRDESTLSVPRWSRVVFCRRCKCAALFLIFLLRT
jgi:hypothetical protein